MGALVETVREQGRRSLAMIAEAVDRVPEGHWRRGDGILVPARLLLHVIEAMEFYLSPAPDAYEWGRRFGCDWEGGAIEAIPDRAALAQYLAEVEAAFEAWLETQTDETLLADHAFGWTGPNPLARMIYVMRHTYEHIGEVNALLRQWSLPRVAWR